MDVAEILAAANLRMCGAPARPFRCTNTRPGLFPLSNKVYQDSPCMWFPLKKQKCDFHVVFGCMGPGLSQNGLLITRPKVVHPFFSGAACHSVFLFCFLSDHFWVPLKSIFCKKHGILSLWPQDRMIRIDSRASGTSGTTRLHRP